MKPFEIINEQKKVIEDLTYKLKFSKNKAKDTKAINVLIDTVNCLESMMCEKYYTDVIEMLIYSRMNDHFLRAKVYDGNEIPLPQFWEWFKRDLSLGPTVLKSELKSILKSHELTNKLKDRKNFNTDFANWDKTIAKTMNEIKQSIKWRN